MLEKPNRPFCKGSPRDYALSHPGGMNSSDGESGQQFSLKAQIQGKEAEAGRNSYLSLAGSIIT